MLQPAELAAPREPSPPWVVAVLVHIGCAIASLAFAPGATWLWLEGLSAAGLGLLAGLPRWWMPINLLFFPAVGALLGLHLPATLYLAAFCILSAVNVAAWRHRVPLFLSSGQAAARLARLLPRHGGFRLLDMGCGTGSLLVDLACARPDGIYHGIETAPLSLLLSRWHTRKHATVDVNWGDFWRADLAHYDVVYAYLSPAPMSRLWEKAQREMRPGSLLVSNTFEIPGVAPAFVLPVGDRLGSTLFVWRM